jgi:hypothetical protein
MPGEVRVVVYDSRIQAMSAPGGQVFRYASEKTRRAAAFSKETAPKRTGHLAGTIRHDTRTVRNGAVGRVRVGAPYATFVIHGTPSPIYPHGDFLWVPKFHGSLYRVKRDSVAGQRANNFLERGLRASMAVPYLHRSPRITGNPFG